MNMLNTILIIDDELQIRRLLNIALSAEGYNIIQASYGDSGIQIAANRRPALIILDLGLPDMDGQ